LSNKVSVLVYSRKLGSPVRKAVMVYFAERASDNGEGIWASKASIAAAVECGRSTVIRTINDFVAEGLLNVVGTRACRNGETVEYAINLKAVEDLDPSHSGTRPTAGPVPERDPYPSQSGTPTRPAAGPKPSVKPPREPSVSCARVREALCEVAGEEAVDGFIAHRKAMKKPLTERAAEIIARKLRHHPDPDAVLDESVANGWQGVFPDRGWNERKKAEPDKSLFGFGEWV